MSTVAAALFVRNEITDITGWIAWHFALGFDKIYIYDDHSTDGTEKILQNVEEIFNVEVKKTNKEKEKNFYWRQRDSYLDAIHKSKKDYDWIICLDGDEYVFLDGYSNVQDFLKDFDNFYAIALNWCIYGSSGKVYRPKKSTPESFLYRADKNLLDASLVKSFIRPKKFLGGYQNPHRWNIDKNRYVDTKKEIIKWNGASKEIIWEKAWILHYICRSMEHYVERVKKRKMQNSDGGWKHFNRNNVKDESALLFIKNTNKNISHINNYIIKKSIYGIRKKINVEKDIVPLKKADCYQLKTFHNSIIVYDKNLLKVVHANCFDEKKHYRICIFVREHYENYGEIRICDNNTVLDNFPLLFNHDYDCSILPYRLCEIENSDEDFVYIKNLSRNYYLSCNKPNYIGSVDFNRVLNKNWEKIYLEKIENNYFNSPKVYSQKFNGDDIKDLFIFISRINEEINPSELSLYYNNLESNDGSTFMPELFSII